MNLNIRSKLSSADGTSRLAGLPDFILPGHQSGADTLDRRQSAMAAGTREVQAARLALGLSQLAALGEGLGGRRERPRPGDRPTLDPSAARRAATRRECRTDGADVRFRWSARIV